MEDVDSNEDTQAGIAADRIMADIRTGVLAPGQKLTIVELRRRYGIGASPLREALSFVTSLGYATSESHRGCRVAQMSPGDLADITRAREIIEIGMLRESLAAHSDEWAIGIITAAERLRRLIARSSSDRIDGSDPIKAAHKQLHVALVAGCASPRLSQMQDLLFDQACRYRDIMIGEVRSPIHFAEAHDDLVKTVLSGNIEQACNALREHLRRTLHEVYATDLPDSSAESLTVTEESTLPVTA